MTANVARYWAASGGGGGGGGGSYAGGASVGDLSEGHDQDEYLCDNDGESVAYSARVSAAAGADAAADRLQSRLAMLQNAADLAPPHGLGATSYQQQPTDGIAQARATSASGHFGAAVAAAAANLGVGASAVATSTDTAAAFARGAAAFAAAHLRPAPASAGSIVAANPFAAAAALRAARLADHVASPPSFAQQQQGQGQGQGQGQRVYSLPGAYAQGGYAPQNAGSSSSPYVQAEVEEGYSPSWPASPITTSSPRPILMPSQYAAASSDGVSLDIDTNPNTDQQQQQQPLQQQQQPQQQQYLPPISPPSSGNPF